MAKYIYMALNKEVFKTTLEKETSTEAGKESLKYWGYFNTPEEAEVKLKENIQEMENLLSKFKN